MKLPRLFEINTFGDPSLGYISILEGEADIPFKIKRVYWTYYTPDHVQRGGHAHKTLSQLIVAVSGEIQFTLIDKDNNKYNFTLKRPNKGLFIPPGYWRDIIFSHNAVLLCVASDVFDEKDYIRDFSQFLKSNVG